jgi:two-component system response regulator FixJ
VLQRVRARQPWGIDDDAIARGPGVSAPLAEKRDAMTNLIGRQISVIDGDVAVRDAAFAMLDGVGFGVRTYMSGKHFLSDYAPRGGCILANVLLPDMDGLELLQHITQQGMDMPVVFFSEENDVPLAVATMKAGAVDFLLRPFSPPAVIASMENALRIG